MHLPVLKSVIALSFCAVPIIAAVQTPGRDIDASKGSANMLQAQTLASTPPVERLRTELHGRQHPSSCTHPGQRYLVFQYDFEDDINGFAAIFQFLAAALSLAHALNRTLVEAVPSYSAGRVVGTGHDRWLRAPHAVCAGLKHGCYFEHLSSCVWSGPVKQLPLYDPAQPIMYAEALAVRMERIATYKPIMVNLTNGHYAPQYWKDTTWCKDWQGLQDSASPCWSVLWYPALQAWLYRPRHAVLAPVLQAVGAEQEEDVAFDVGIHVRRGDSLNLNWRTHAGSPEYARTAGFALLHLPVAQRPAGRQTAGKGRIVSRQVYIATDSYSTKQELGRLLEESYPPLVAYASPAVVLVSSQVGPDGTQLQQESTAHIETLIAQRTVAATGSALDGESLSAIPYGGTEEDAVMFVAGQPVLLLNGRRHRPLPSAAASSAVDTPTGGIMDLRDWCSSLPNPALCSSGVDPSHASGSRGAIQAAVEVWQLTAGVIADIWALSKAQALVGTCLSQVSRTALDLQYASGRAVSPGRALDMDLCGRVPHDVAMLTPWQGR